MTACQHPNHLAVRITRHIVSYIRMLVHTQLHECYYYFWVVSSVVSTDKFRLRLSHRRLLEDQIFPLSQSTMMLKWCFEFWLSSVCPLYSSSTRLVTQAGSAVCMNIKVSHCLDYQEGVCVCACVPEQSLKLICSANGQFRAGFSVFNSERSSLLNCNKAWFCFRTLHWISYTLKKSFKSKPHISTGFHHWFLMPLSYLSKFSLVCNANVETTVCTSSKPHQSRANMWSQCVLAGITQSVCIVLVSVLHWSSMHAKTLVRLQGSKTSRNYGCK